MLSDFRFHHIGYAVKDIDKVAMFYKNAGWKISDTVLDPVQNTYIAFMTKENMPRYELVAPVDDKSPIVNIIKKHGGVAPYHVCYAVDNIKYAVDELKKLHFVQLFEPVPAIAIDNKLICYLYNRFVGLIEIVEEK